MTTPQIGTKGDRLDILIRQGATFGPMQCTVLKADGSPEDLTGCKFVAEIRKTPDAPGPAASAVFEMPDPLAGRFNYSFLAPDTKPIPCAPEGETSPDSLYVWDLEIHYPSGMVRPMLYGDALVFREVSKGTPA